MTWVAVAVVGGAVVGGVASNASSKRAAGASTAGSNASINEQGRQYDQTRADFAGQRSLGNSALDQLARLYGYAPPSQAANIDATNQGRLVGNTYLPAGTDVQNYNGKTGDVIYNGRRLGHLESGGPNGKFVNETGEDTDALLRNAQVSATAPGASAPGASGAPDMSGFFESPDFQFNLQQQQKAIDRAAAAGGRFQGGRTALELQRNASGNASNEYGTFTNRLLAMAGLGQTATSNTAAAGQNAANNNSAALLNAGNQRASAYMQNGENINNAVQGGISNYLTMQYLKNPPSYGTPPYNPTGTTYPRQTGWSGPR